MSEKTIPWALIEDLLQDRGRNREWLERELNVETNNISNWKKRGVPKNRAGELARALKTTADFLLLVPGALRDLDQEMSGGPFPADDDRRHIVRRAGDVPIIQLDDDLVIPQYDTGGAMGNGGLRLDDQPGLIRSWHVNHEWVRLNVRSHTGLQNLCIVTGFGPSMRPMFNPGDPLLVDRGVTDVDSDAVYFFRLGKHGFIKSIQRIPKGNSMIYRAKSKNPDFDTFDIDETMDFQVLGKVLTVWKSEQF